MNAGSRRQWVHQLMTALIFGVVWSGIVAAIVAVFGK